MKKSIIIFIVMLFTLSCAVGCGCEKDNKPSDPVNTKDTITISFDTNGGNSVDDIKVEKGKTFELPIPIKEGFKFIGWYDGDTEFTFNDSTSIDKNIKLTAKWEEVKVEENKVASIKINFDSKGGSKVNAMTLKCTNNVATVNSLPKPKKDSYEFVSWVDKFGKAILNGAKFTCDGDIKLYANWQYDGPVANPNQGDDTPTTPVTAKTYKCQSGYELKDTNKCVKLAEPVKYCENGWKEYKGECVNLKSPNVNGTRYCEDKTYSGTKLTGIYYEAGRGYCGYGEMPSYTGTQSGCQNAGGVYAYSVKKDQDLKNWLNRYITVE